MLPLRLGVVTAVAALCLWGLFSLLDSLQKPGLLRSGKAAVVKGCDALESDEARRDCPLYFCEKALIDGKQVPLTARFEVLVNETRDGATHIGVTATANTDPPRSFACEVQASRVVSAELVEEPESENLLEE